MLRLHDRASWDRVTDADLRRLIELRFSQVLDGEPYDPERHGEWILVEPGDTGEALEEATGVPILSNPFAEVCFGRPEFVPVCEVLEEHRTCYEFGILLSDDGAGVTFFIPKSPGIDAELLRMCAAFAVPATDLTSR